VAGKSGVLAIRQSDSPDTAKCLSIPAIPIFHYPYAGFPTYSSALKIQISAILRPSRIKPRANGSPMEFLIPGKKRSLKETVNFT